MMDITIPATTADFNQLLLLIPGAFLAVAILAGLVVVTAPGMYPKRGEDIAKRGEDIAEGALIIAVSSLIISMFGSIGMVGHYESQKHGEVREAVQKSLYEEYGVAGLTSEGEGRLDASEVGCWESGPSTMERPRISVEWVGEDGRGHRGSLTNMGNVDGECRLVLADGDLKIGPQ